VTERATDAHIRYAFLIKKKHKNSKSRGLRILVKKSVIQKKGIVFEIFPI